MEEADGARWVWVGEPKASELVLVDEEEHDGMVGGVQHGALGALRGQCALHGEWGEEAWQSLEEGEEL